MITVKIDKTKKLGCDYSMFLSFPYDNRIIEIVRAYPQKFWDKENKTWELPLDKLASLIDKLPEQEFDISGKYVELPKIDAKMPKGFKFKTNPFQHQIDGFNFGLAHDRWFLGDEQGLGKTKQAIDIAVAKKLQRGYHHCLIVCGVNGLKWNWMEEIKIHSNESAFILGQQKNGKIGSNADKLNDAMNLDKHDEFFVITNVESLRDEAIRIELEKACNSKEIGIVVIDEIHKCKNPTSQQGKGILKLKSEVRIAMTGTPVMNTPIDLYVILRWLGYESHTFYAFRNHYCEMGGFGGYEIIGYKNLSELRSRLDEIMLRRLKKEVLDLPEKLYINEYVEMNDKQWKIYNSVANEIRDNIDKVKTSPNPLAELIRMRQATGYTGILSSKVFESAKLDRMEELVEEAIENGKKVVIFSNWTQMTDAICERLNDVRKYNFDYAVITGETKDADRQKIVNRFQNDDNTKVIIGTIGAMGTGLTLTAGTVEIFLDEPWTRAAKEQAEDRCHRVGTNENVTIYTIMCKSTIDERIHELVMSKGAMADALVDGKINNSRAEVLDYLLS